MLRVYNDEYSLNVQKPFIILNLPPLFPKIRNIFYYHLYFNYLHNFAT